MNGVYFYFVNKLFLVGRYWDFNEVNLYSANKHTALNPLPDDKILDWLKLKQIADDSSKCI